MKRYAREFDLDDAVPILAPLPEKEVEEKKEDDSRRKKEEEDLQTHAYREGMYKAVIESIISNEPRTEWQEAMRDSQCFVRMWHDEDDDSFCSELSCPLRSICEGGWDRVYGQEFRRAKKRARKVPDKADKLTLKSVDFSIELNRFKASKFARPKKEVPKRGKFKNTYKYTRVDYIPSGRPIDYLAQDLWEFLGSPILLPSGWSYNNAKINGVLENAKVVFAKKFGTILCVTKKVSYHLYYFDGEQLLRLWVNSATSGWMDLNKELSKVFLSNGILVNETPRAKSKNKYKYFPYRYYIKTDDDIDIVKHQLAQYRGLEYLESQLLPDD